jgi:pimeloyl-ACP methyl ester carboxylesterase
VVSIADCGHMAMQEQPEAVALAMQQWLSVH